MNVKELKELAERWDHAARGSMTSANAAWAMYKAIMALPDDPPAEHQDLVEMAQEIQLSVYHENGPAMKLANAVINRFGKKEPRREEFFAIITNKQSIVGGFDCREKAEAYRKKCLDTKDYWLARVIATEEV